MHDPTFGTTGHYKSQHELRHQNHLNIMLILEDLHQRIEEDALRCRRERMKQFKSSDRFPNIIKYQDLDDVTNGGYGFESKQLLEYRIHDRFLKKCPVYNLSLIHI